MKKKYLEAFWDGANQVFFGMEPDIKSALYLEDYLHYFKKKYKKKSLSWEDYFICANSIWKLAKKHLAKTLTELNNKSKEEIISWLQTEKKRDLIQTHQSSGRSVISARYSGPIPLPSHLAQYNQIIPNGAERIFAMVENEQKSQHKMVGTQLTNEAYFRTRGQCFALPVIILGLGLAGTLAFYGHEVTAGIIGGMGLASLAGLFIGSFKKEEGSPKEKNK